MQAAFWISSLAILRADAPALAAPAMERQLAAMAFLSSPSVLRPSWDEVTGCQWGGMGPPAWPGQPGALQGPRCFKVMP